MKYMRKTPVEAIQWNGTNRKEVHDFIINAANSCCTQDDGFGRLIIVFENLREQAIKTVLPKYGWVVREGKNFHFYRNPSFKRTFEEVQEDGNKGIDWERFINAMKEPIGGFDNVPKGFKDILGEYLWSPFTPAFVDVDGLYKGDEKTREEIKKNLSEGLKEMAGSDTNKATFESVLDEMKELHAKKNSDYGDAAHVNFLKYGPVASLSRLSEKMQRAEHILLSGKCEVKDEPLTETLIDIAITSAMLYMELKNKKNG